MTGGPHRKQPYPYVTAWGRHVGTRDYYIEEQVVQAVVDGAPNDAIFRDTEGVWHTLAELERPAPELRARLEAEGVGTTPPRPATTSLSTAVKDRRHVVLSNGAEEPLEILNGAGGGT